MTRRVRSLDARILLCSVAAFVLLGPLRGEVPPVVSFAATLLLFMVPGTLATHWFFREYVTGPAVVPVAFALSTGVFGLLGVPALILHQSTELYLWTAGAVLAAFLAGAGWRVLRARAFEAELMAEPVAEGDARYGPSAGWLWAPFALLGGGLAFVATRRVPNNYDDIWVYLSWVRDFAGAERLALRDPYFGERVAELSRVKVNGWLLEQAALSRVSGLDPIELVLRYLTPTLVILALLAVYALARTLLKSERAAVLSASVYALFHVVFIEP